MGEGGGEKNQTNLKNPTKQNKQQQKNQTKQKNQPQEEYLQYKPEANGAVRVWLLKCLGFLTITHRERFSSSGIGE